MKYMLTLMTLKLWQLLLLRRLTNTKIVESKLRLLLLLLL